MTILAADLLFFAAQYPLDLSYGGGLMGGTAVQDGVGNNVFPNIALADRTSGRVQMRKVYAAALNTDSTSLYSAQVRIKTRPTDTAVEAMAFAWGDQTTTRGTVETALALSPFAVALGAVLISGYTVSGTYTATFATDQPAVGDMVALCDFDVVPGSAPVAKVYRTVSGVAGTTVTFAEPLTLAGSLGKAYPAITNSLAPRCCGQSVLTGSSGSDDVTTDRIMVNLLPSPSASPVAGFAPSTAALAKTGGKVPIFRPGDAVLIEQGGTSETALVESINYYTGALTFTTALAHSYTAGATVSSLVTVGDMQPFAGASFSQQTWTKVFSDSVIGNLISANYNRAAGAIAVDGLGAITERWAFVFTSSTEFKLIGENVGQVATGDIGTLFEPVNPITGGKYMSVPVAGWGGGYGIGNVVRLNTLGSRAPVWLTRTTSPSSPGGSDQVYIDVRGSV